MSAKNTKIAPGGGNSATPVYFKCMEENIKNIEFSPIAARDATYVEPYEEKPIIIDTSPRGEYERIKKETHSPVGEQPLNIVSPEFDILTLVRSLATLPKGFLKGNGRVPIKEGNYYRQIARKSNGIEDAFEKGVIQVNSMKGVAPKVPGQIMLRKEFDVPFFRKDKLWYPDSPTWDVIVGRNTKGITWQPINKSGIFIKQNTITRPSATPLVNGVPNKAPISEFTFYRHYPIIGYRNVTNGFPYFPITGLNTISNIVVNSGNEQNNINE